MMNKDLLKSISGDRSVRQAVTRESHLMFFHIYFPHYVQYEIAEFQKDIFRITEDQSNKLACICAFRGSGKSTLITFSYPLWAILGVQAKKFALIICQTRGQVKQHMMNLKRELESNQVLRSDLGPFQEENDEWGSMSLVFSKLNARITAASSEQSIRGLRHNQYRPDLIICDDVEDLASTKTHESRQKTYNWFSGEVVPTGDLNTRVIVIGNLLHEDSLIMHLKRDMEEGQRDGIFRACPLLDKNGNIAWPGKYPTKEDIQSEKKKSGNEYAWQREYLLRIIADEDQVIHKEWIQYYDEVSDYRNGYHGIFMGVDLAISEKDTADSTAIVSALIMHKGKDFCMYVLPNIINRRMDFPKTIQQIGDIYNANKQIYTTNILVEEVGYQKAVIDQLRHLGYRADGVKITSDKRSRLITLADLIKQGKIKFPKKGAEPLLRQIIGFGSERHDDLVDAFTIVGHKAIELDRGSSGSLILWSTGPRPRSRYDHLHSIDFPPITMNMKF